MAPGFRLGSGWLPRSPHSLLTNDYLKHVLMVDHKRGDQRCMMPRRVLGQKKVTVTSAPALLSKACHMAKPQINAYFTALQVMWQKEEKS